MEWLHGPIDSKTVLWLGFQAFWWNRGFNVLQIISAAALLLNFLNQQQRMKLHSWATEKAQAAAQVRVPHLMGLRVVAKRAIPVILLLAATIAGLITFLSTSATVSVFLRLFLVFAFFLALLAIPITSFIIALTTLYAVVRAGQRYGPPILAWTLDTSRFELSLAVFSFLLFLVASMGQLCLS